ncbi:MAG: HDIG domain-containing metalloprotein [Candidatus Muiribacteriaceae bacterium]
MNRSEAYELLKENIESPNLISHSLAVEACMRHFADRFGHDPDKWGNAGLLHDLDYEETKEDPEKHGRITIEMLKDKLDPESLDAILAHPGHRERTTLMDKVLYAVDPVTGFLVACALMSSSKTIEGLKLKSMKKKFKSKTFAAGADRDQIKSCADFDMELWEFIQECQKAMTTISDELGL